MTASAAMLVTFAGCGSSSPSTTASGSSGGATSTTADLSSVTLTVGDFFGSIQAQLQAANEASTPYTIKWTEFTSGPPMLAAEIGGSVDISIASDTPVIFALAAGDPIKMVAEEAPQDPAHQEALAVLVPVNSPIHSISDLRGKKIGITTGSIAQYMAAKVLKTAGMGLSDVDAVNLQPTAETSALVSGSLDALITSEPFISLLTVTGKARILTTNAGLFQTVSVLVSPSADLSNPAKVAALSDFIHRMYLASKYLATHKNAQAQADVSTEHLPLAMAQAEVNRGSPSILVPVTSTRIGFTQAQADFFTSIGVLTKKLNVKSGFTTMFNKSVQG